MFGDVRQARLRRVDGSKPARRGDLSVVCKGRVHELWKKRFWLVSTPTAGFLFHNTALNEGLLASASQFNYVRGLGRAASPYALRPASNEQEDAWESVRLARARLLPSRADAIFLYDDLQVVRYLLENWCRGDTRHVIEVRVVKGARLHKADMRWLELGARRVAGAGGALLDRRDDRPPSARGAGGRRDLRAALARTALRHRRRPAEIRRLFRSYSGPLLRAADDALTARLDAGQGRSAGFGQDRKADGPSCPGHWNIPMPPSIYRYILDTTVRRQLPICLLTLVVVGLSMAPLELQRRIMNDALGERSPTLLVALGALYLVTLLVQGGLKYALNLSRGKLVEDTTRRLREAIFGRIAPMLAAARPDDDGSRLESGAVVSMVASEAEDVGGFVGDAISLPLLQGGTVIAITGYLLWLEPLIASFAVIVYLPQFFIVPRVQHAINRLARVYARQVRRLGDLVVQTGAGGAAAASFAEPFRRTATSAYDTRVHIYRRKFFLTALGNFLDAAGPLAILMVGGWMVIHRGIDVGTIVVFISGFQRIAGPWDELVNYYRAASNAQTKYLLMRDTMMATG